jgi:hypothetical protein
MILEQPHIWETTATIEESSSSANDYSQTNPYHHRHPWWTG